MAESVPRCQAIVTVKGKPGRCDQLAVAGTWFAPSTTGRFGSNMRLSVEIAALR
jgi:hypothetical protein